MKWVAGATIAGSVIALVGSATRGAGDASVNFPLPVFFADARPNNALPIQLDGPAPHGAARPVYINTATPSFSLPVHIESAAPNLISPVQANEIAPSSESYPVQVAGAANMALPVHIDRGTFNPAIPVHVDPAATSPALPDHFDQAGRGHLPVHIDQAAVQPKPQRLADVPPGPATTGRAFHNPALPVHIEPMQVEPVQVEPVQVEPVHIDPVHIAERPPNRLLPPVHVDNSFSSRPLALPSLPSRPREEFPSVQPDRFSGHDHVSPQTSNWPNHPPAPPLAGQHAAQTPPETNYVTGQGNSLPETTIAEMMQRLDAQSESRPFFMAEYQDGQPLAEASPSDAPPVPPGSESSGLIDGDTYGEEPVDNSYQFLRQVSVLLNPGQWQFDYGLHYTFVDNDLLVFVPAEPGVIEGRFRQRLFEVPLAVRYGLSDRVQLFLNAPVGWSHSELSFAGFEEFDNSGGIGDVSFGASLLVKERCGTNPDVIFTMAATAPTANASSTFVAQTPGSQLGEGFWAASGNLLFVHTTDPVVVYYGGGVRYRFEETFLDSFSIQPGIDFNYLFGVGFAANERITLSATLLGSYITETEFNGVGLENTTLEPIRMRFAVTIAQGCRILEPFATIGMTDDAADARLGITVTR